MPDLGDPIINIGGNISKYFISFSLDHNFSNGRAMTFSGVSMPVFIFLIKDLIFTYSIILFLDLYW